MKISQNNKIKAWKEWYDKKLNKGSPYLYKKNIGQGGELWPNTTSLRFLLEWKKPIDSKVSTNNLIRCRIGGRVWSSFFRHFITYWMTIFESQKTNNCRSPLEKANSNPCHNARYSTRLFVVIPKPQANWVSISSSRQNRTPPTPALLRLPFNAPLKNKTCLPNLLFHIQNSCESVLIKNEWWSKTVGLKLPIWCESGSSFIKSFFACESSSNSFGS